MGADSTYYFAPEAVPYNPHLAKDQRDALTWFGQNNAKWFDKFGFDYFTREVFDAFYPGYGASWPAYYGAVAMTYEQASARGLAGAPLRRDQVFHFRDTVRQHFVASVSTCETAARNREKLLANFWRYRRTAIEEGQQGAGEGIHPGPQGRHLGGRQTRRCCWPSRASKSGAPAQPSRPAARSFRPAATRCRWRNRPSG